MRSLEWQSVKHAAARMGINAGHLRRLCLHGRLPKGATARRRLATGRTGWFVRSDFVPQHRNRSWGIDASDACILIHIHTPEHLTIDVFGSGSKGR